MNLSNFKVGTRLGFGFLLLLLATLVVGGVGLMRLSQLDRMVVQITEVDWTKARLAMEMETRNRENAAKFSRLLLVDAESEKAAALKAKIASNSELNAAALKELETLITAPEGKALLVEANAAREIFNASRAEVMKLVADPKTRAAGLEQYNMVTADLIEPYVEALHKLTVLQKEIFEKASEESGAAYDHSRNVIVSIIGASVIFGIVLAILLARSIVRPLGNAVSVAESIKDGRLDNAIDISGKDETSKLLGSLDIMQSALRARDEKDADSRGKIAAISKSQTAAEFSMDGTVLDANDNFLRVMGYSLAEIKVSITACSSTRPRAKAVNTAPSGTRWRAANSTAASTSVLPRAAGKSGCRLPTTRSPISTASRSRSSNTRRTSPNRNCATRTSKASSPPSARHRPSSSSNSTARSVPSTTTSRR